MNEESLFKFRKMFPDATMVKLAIDNPKSWVIRSCIPSAACILYYKTTRNYTSVIWSQLAKEVGYTDATDDCEWCGPDIKVSRKGLNLTIQTSFRPFKKNGFIAALEKSTIIIIDSIRSMANGGGIVRAAMYTEKDFYKVLELIKKADIKEDEA